MPKRAYDRNVLVLVYDYLTEHPEAGYPEIDAFLARHGLTVKANTILKQLQRKGCIEIERLTSGGRFANSKKKCIKRPVV